MSYKTDNGIFADVIAIVKNFLNVSGQSGWAVVQGYQPRQFALHDKLIALSHVSRVRVGWQGGEDKEIYTSGGGMVLTHYERWREEVKIQFNCFCNRKPGTDTVETWTAEDMANRLIAFFGSEAGIAALLARGYNRLRTEYIRNANILNSSEDYQIVPGFDLTILLEQELQTDAPEAIIKGYKIVGV